VDNEWWKYELASIQFLGHIFSIVNGLDVIRLFVFGWDFPTGGRNFGVVFGQNDLKNVN